MLLHNQDTATFTSAELERALGSGSGGRRGAMHPSSTFRKWWDILITVLGWLVFVFQPLDSAFGVWGEVVAVSVVVDLVFVLDVYVQVRHGATSLTRH